MFCPNCGSDNPGTPRFCSNCGAVLQVLTVEPLGRSVAFDETVFVPSFEDLEDRNISPNFRPLPETIFEDDAADDEFEQSLSGLRIDELDEAEPVVISKPEDPVEEFVPVAREATLFERDRGLTIADEPADVEQQGLSFSERSVPLVATLSVEQTTRRVWPRRLAMTFSSLLAGAILFATGFVTAAWVFAPLESQVPAFDEAVVISEEPEKPDPPPGMVYVRGGEFVMGTDLGDRFSRPAHRVTIAAFFIDATEVTNDAYAKFVSATNNDPPANWKNEIYPEGEANFPVTGITWYDAAEYAAWAGKRLPSEAEWEFAARGPDGRIFPWGDEWDAEMANAGGSEGLRPVGRGGRSQFGVYDMAGNAWEWTASDARAYPNGREVPWSRLRLKVIRGGNWQSPPEKAASTFRGFYGAAGEREYNGTGFRCVKDIPKN